MPEQKKRNQYEFDKRKYDHLHVQVSKGSKTVIESAARSRGESMNGYVKKAVKTQIKTDTGQDVEL
jgi:predicted HicB family RNase H-like nuclease